MHYLTELEADSPQDLNLEVIMKFVFSEHNNSHETHHMEAQEHLMSMLGDMVAREGGCQTYCDKFLAQKSVPDPTANKS